MSALVVSAERILEQLDAAEAADARLTAQNRRRAQTAADLRDRQRRAQRAPLAAAFEAYRRRELHVQQQIALARQRRHDELELLDAEISRCVCGGWRISSAPCRACSVLAGRQAIA